MQKDRDFLFSVAKRNNGVIRYSDVESAGISKDIFLRFIKNNAFEKVSHGIYISPDTFPDELYLMQLRFPKIIFSHETALYLHELSEMEPSPVSVTVCRTYNSKSLIAAATCINYCPVGIYNLGLAEISSNYGNPLRIYDRERTVCDIIKKRKSIDASVFNYAIREYVKSNDKKLNTLMDYAKKMNIEKTVRNTMEILL